MCMTTCRTHAVRRARGSPSHLSSTYPLSHHSDVAVIAYLAVEDWLRIVTVALELNAAHCTVIPRELGSDLGSKRRWVLASQPLVLSPLGFEGCEE